MTLSAFTKFDPRASLESSAVTLHGPAEDAVGLSLGERSSI